MNLALTVVNYIKVSLMDFDSYSDPGHKLKKKKQFGSMINNNRVPTHNDLYTRITELGM